VQNQSQPVFQLPKILPNPKFLNIIMVNPEINPVDSPSNICKKGAGKEVI
jgi:hypothetical protein